MKKLAILVATTTVLAAGSAQAGDFKFKFDRELLDSQSGVEKVYKRLASRVESHCEVTGVAGIGSTLDRSMETACFGNTLNQAVSKINHRSLTRLHNDYERMAAR